MRPAREIRMISIQLDLFKSQKKRYELLISEIDQAIENVERWLKGTEMSKDFAQMLQYNEEVIDEISQKCLQIADSKFENETLDPNKPDSEDNDSDSKLNSAKNQREDNTSEKELEEIVNLKETVTNLEKKYLEKEKEFDKMKLALDNHTHFIESLKECHNQRFDNFETKIEERLRQLQGNLDVMGSSKNTQVEILENKITEQKTMLENALHLLSSKRAIKEFVGFHARINSEQEIYSNTKANYFTIVPCHVGNCYDADTGIFTAPHSGHYVVSISLDSKTQGLIDAVIYKRDNNSKEIFLASVNVGVKDTNAGTVCLVEMFKMEEIYVSVRLCPSGAILTSYSTFSCFSM